MSDDGKIIDLMSKRAKKMQKSREESMMTTAKGISNFHLSPETVIDPIRQIMLEPGIFHRVLAPISWYGTKEDRGRLLIVAGSKGMMGAAAFCAQAADAAGAGLVRLWIPEDQFAIAQTLVPNATCEDRNLYCRMAEEDTEALKQKLSIYRAIVFGPGLGECSEAETLLREILKNYEGRLVLDADGLNMLSRLELASEVAASKAEIVMTPHYREMCRLLAIDPHANIPDAKMGREGMALQYALFASRVLEKYRCSTVVMKHANTVVAAMDKLYINASGNIALAKGGSGDVLAGMLGAFAMSGADLMESAICATYLHGSIGAAASLVLSEKSVNPQKMIEMIGLGISAAEKLAATAWRYDR